MAGIRAAQEMSDIGVDDFVIIESQDCTGGCMMSITAKDPMGRRRRLKQEQTEYLILRLIKNLQTDFLPR